MIFFPEVQNQLEKLNKSSRLKFVLVDHNRLAVSQEKYEESVIEIVDHHKDESRCKNAKNDKRNIEMVGSCATLVAEKLLKGAPSLVTKIEARVLLAPILLDTVNLDPKYEKSHKERSRDSSPIT